MTEITIDPVKQSLSIEVKSLSLHVLTFSIKVNNPAPPSKNEKYEGDTNTNNPFRFDLQKQTVNYKGCYFFGTYSFVSPDGKDYPYKASITIFVNNAPVSSIPISGTTTNGNDVVFVDFHLK